MARQVRTSTRAKTAKSAAQARPRPVKPSVRRHRALRHLRKFQKKPSSGLQTPEHLVEVSKKNATDSPLLCLPAEIRNMIFTFVFSGEKVKISKPYDEVDYVQFHRDSDVSAGFPCKLPQVCRQLYSETSILSYSETTFVSYGNKAAALTRWASKLPPVYIDAIAKVAIRRVLAREWSVKNVFPSVKLVVTIIRQYAPFPHSEPKTEVFADEMSRIQKVQGIDVEVAIMIARSHYGRIYH